MHAKDQQRLDDFFQYLEVEKRLSEHTLKNYRRDIKHLKSYCADKIQHWSDIQAADIRRHIANRHKKGLSSKSLQRELSAIRSFYNYQLKKHLLEVNPALHIRGPKQKRKLLPYIKWSL